jgi:hypothetical protein
MTFSTLESEVFEAEITRESLLGLSSLLLILPITHLAHVGTALAFPFGFAIKEGERDKLCSGSYKLYIQLGRPNAELTVYFYTAGILDQLEF